MKKRLAFLLALFMILAVLCACAGKTEPADTGKTGTTTVEPVTTEPTETEPKATEPIETEPKATEPIETEPKETEPIETEPKETEPPETKPKETEPPETKPRETQPPEPKKVTSISVNAPKTTLTVGESIKVTPNITPSDAGNKTLSWRSTDSSVASVSSNGTVKALKEGTTTIRALANDGSGKSGELTITVIPAQPTKIETVELFLTKTEIKVGKSVKITARVNPTNAVDRSLKWTVTDQKVVTVDQNGNVTAVGGGTAVIRATSKATPSVYAEVTITVPMPEPHGTAYTYTDTGAPIGTGIGVNPGRVTWVHDPKAFNWGGSGYWWLEKNFDTDAVKQMLVDAICGLAGKETVNEALDALIRDFNKRKTGTASGYTAGQKIFIKANMNVTGNGSATANNMTEYFPTPVTIRSLLELLVDFGVAPSDIAIGDPSRIMPTYVSEYCSAGKLKGVRFVSYDSNPAKDAKADLTKPVVWSHDLTLDEWPDYNGKPTVNTTYWPKEATEATYLINLFNLRGHNLAGYTGTAKNHFGTIMPGYTDKNGTVSFPNDYRTNPPSWAGVHHYVAAVDGFFMNPKELWDLPKRPMGTYTVLVDLLSNADCGGKTFLYLCDALAATVDQGATMKMDQRFCSAPFGDGTKNGKAWTNSILASQDPIAIDSVGMDILRAEKAAAEANGDKKWNSVIPDNGTAENYLIEAALADNPPSGTYYYDGHGNRIKSLGTHEHWNNANDRQYSRNLGKNEGIELIEIEK